MLGIQGKKDVALVLSSGGARGLAHIGAIEELEGQGYHITSVAGCSMGALVGGMYAAGRLAEFKQWMMSVDKMKILSLLDVSLSINHLVKGVKIIDALKEIVPDVMIEDLRIPSVPWPPTGRAAKRWCSAGAASTRLSERLSRCLSSLNPSSATAW